MPPYMRGMGWNHNRFSSLFFRSFCLPLIRSLKSSPFILLLDHKILLIFVHSIFGFFQYELLLLPVVLSFLRFFSHKKEFDTILLGSPIRPILLFLYLSFLSSYQLLSSFILMVYLAKSGKL